MEKTTINEFANLLSNYLKGKISTKEFMGNFDKNFFDYHELTWIDNLIGKYGKENLEDNLRMFIDLFNFMLNMR